jgi:hypothetical protein
MFANRPGEDPRVLALERTATISVCHSTVDLQRVWPGVWMSADPALGCQRSGGWMSPVESEQLARMEGVREVLGWGERAVVFDD